MSNEPIERDPKQVRASDTDREEVAQILHDAVAEGRLTVGELDERLRTVYAAKTIGELEPVTSDLPTPVTHGSARQPDTRSGGAPSGSSSIAILGGADRKGPWVVPARYTVVSIMGRVDIDLTEARFTSRETVIMVCTLMGGVDIIVPEDIRVRVDGVGILGDFDDRVPDIDISPGSPVVRVTGVAIMGGVDIKYPKRKKRKRVGK